MAVIRWYDYPEYGRPLGTFEKLQREMNRLMSDFTTQRSTRTQAGVFPLVNISEDQEKLYVVAELPGMKPEDVEISVEGETLTFRGEKKTAEVGESVNYHRQEREFGRFRRIITLPARIDPDAVSAVFKHGVLEITLSKAKETLPKQIKVVSEG